MIKIDIIKSYTIVYKWSKCHISLSSVFDIFPALCVLLKHFPGRSELNIFSILILSVVLRSCHHFVQLHSRYTPSRKTFLNAINIWMKQSKATIVSKNCFNNTFSQNNYFCQIFEKFRAWSYWRCRTWRNFCLKLHYAMWVVKMEKFQTSMLALRNEFYWIFENYILFVS